MKHTKKCSALLAASAGAAVCLTGSGAHAAFIMGNMTATNADNTFGFGDIHYCFDGKAYWHWQNWTATGLANSWPPGSTYPERVSGGDSHIRMRGAGETLNSANFWGATTLPAGISDQYFGVQFEDGGVRYGWVHVVSSTASSAVMDTWGYENTGASVKTLADSVTARKLGLSDGRTQLHWTNANEDGVARYEVQAKDASGVWNAVSSEAPGAGMYSFAVPKGSECRVVVEKVDGTAENVAF